LHPLNLPLPFLQPRVAVVTVFHRETLLLTVLLIESMFGTEAVLSLLADITQCQTRLSKT